MDSKVPKANTEKAKEKERARGNSHSEKDTKLMNKKVGARPKEKATTLVSPSKMEKQILQALSQLH